MKGKRFLKVTGIVLICAAVLSIAAAFYGVIILKNKVTEDVESKAATQNALADYTELTKELESGRTDYDAAKQTMAENETSYAIANEQYAAEKAAYDVAEKEYMALLASSQYEDIENSERKKAELDMQKGRLDSLLSSMSVYEAAQKTAAAYEEKQTACDALKATLESSEVLSAAGDGDLNAAFAESMNAKSDYYTASLFLYAAMCVAAICSIAAASLGLTEIIVALKKKRTAAVVFTVLAIVLGAVVPIYCAITGMSVSLCLNANAAMQAALALLFLVALLRFKPAPEEE